MARRLMSEEGIMCGGSSGTAMWAAIKYNKENRIGAGKRCVVLLPDNIRIYMTKHLNDDWMYERGYISEEVCTAGATSGLIPNTDWGQDITVGSLDLPEANQLNFLLWPSSLSFSSVMVVIEICYPNSNFDWR